MKKNKGLQRKNRQKHGKKNRAVTPVAPLKMKVKRGDTVKILSGKDKGKTGEVAKVFPRENKVVVDGVALAKRHLRSTGRGQSGRIVERPMKIHASNVSKVGAAKAPAKKAAKKAA